MLIKIKEKKLKKKQKNIWWFEKKSLPLHSLSGRNERVPKTTRAFSSAGSEHLPYKQRVGGSNPSTPTIDETKVTSFFENLKHYSFGSLAQLNRAFDYGSKGYRFESCASHFEMKN